MSLFERVQWLRRQLAIEANNPYSELTVCSVTQLWDSPRFKGIDPALRFEVMAAVVTHYTKQSTGVADSEDVRPPYIQASAGQGGKCRFPPEGLDWYRDPTTSEEMRSSTRAGSPVPSFREECVPSVVLTHAGAARCPAPGESSLAGPVPAEEVVISEGRCTLLL